MPLTDTAIKKAKFEDKPYRLTDGGGLYLIVHHRGDLRRTRLPSLPGLGRAESCHSMCWARMAAGSRMSGFHQVCSVAGHCYIGAGGLYQTMRGNEKE